MERLTTFGPGVSSGLVAIGLLGYWIGRRKKPRPLEAAGPDGPAPDARLERIDVRAGALIDGISFHFSDSFELVSQALEARLC